MINKVSQNNDIATVMENSKTIAIAIFNRFGDGVIATVVCNEFISRWAGGGRRFLIVTSPQLSPYIREMCPGAEVMALNRKNPLHWLRLFLIKRWKYHGFDVGINPFSYGKESKKIVRLAKWHAIYSNPKNAMFVNYYDRVRLFMGLEKRGDFQVISELPRNLNGILICPESSELRRSLTSVQLKLIVTQLRDKWPSATITVASTKPVVGLGSEIGFFVLKKNKASSMEFLKIVREIDLVVSVDSGPLHIASALSKQVLALFSSAHPATVINADAKAFPVRSSALDSIYCERIECSNPLCMNLLNFDTEWHPDSTARTIVSDRCPYED